MYRGSLVGQQRIGSGTATRIVANDSGGNSERRIRTKVAVRPSFLYPCAKAERCPSREGEERPVSANGSGKWLAIWLIARRVAAPVIPLLLGAAAMALLLDSGTVHRPPIRAGAGSSAAPAEKVVVSPPAVHRAHHRAVAPANTAAPTSPATGTTTSGVSTSPTQAAAAPQQAATGEKPALQPEPKPKPAATGKTAAP